MLSDRIRAGVFLSDIKVEFGVTKKEIDWWFGRFNIGGSMRPREVFEFLAAETVDTHDYLLSSIDVLTDAATFKIVGNAQTERAFFAQRSVEFQGRLVHQNFLEVEVKFQGQGIGRALARNCYRLARRLDLLRLGVSAVDTGSYVWARAGFLPSPGSWDSENCLGKILTELDELPELDWKLKHDVYSRLDPTKPERIWFVSDLKEPVASKHGAGLITLGKRLLIESEASWHGFLDFENLAGEESSGMRRAIGYLGL